MHARRQRHFCFGKLFMYHFLVHEYFSSFLFQEPNPEDPLNKEAAEVLQNNKAVFEQNVLKSMKGGYISNVYFERCLK